jgi:hypothetical protein
VGSCEVETVENECDAVLEVAIARFDWWPGGVEVR